MVSYAGWSPCGAPSLASSRVSSCFLLQPLPMGNASGSFARWVSLQTPLHAPSWVMLVEVLRCQQSSIGCFLYSIGLCYCTPSSS
jgi:hypothetical protein